jgi:hypothetical protein
MSEEFGTLGQRLADQARRMAARPALDTPWATPFAVLLDHLAALPSPEAGRFTRREVAVAEQAWPDQAHEWRAPAGSPGRPLPSDVVTRLRAAVGPGVEAMRVHDDDAADEMARAHRADAVTVGSDVFFRQGQLNPREPRGFGLLVHEATHVVERSRPGASWHGATTSGARAEENLALAREAAVLPGAGPAPEDSHVPHSPHMPVPSVTQYPAAPLGALAGAPPAAPAAPLLPPVAAPFVPSVAPAGGAPPAAVPVARAAIDRPASGVPVPAGVDVEALRGRIMRDLMRQLRDEFERGG